MELKDYGWDAETAARFETSASPGLDGDFNLRIE